MRIFNTSGPCDPDRHYTVMREELVAKGQRLVEQGRYFTIFAPRQAGKTTYFQLLFRHLATHGYTPVWVSFEGLKTLTRERFYKALHHLLQREFATHDIHSTQEITDPFDVQLYLEQVSGQAQAIVLVIDEFEDIPDVVLSELMHTLRALYQKRDYHKLHALILVGVSTVAELVLSSASPFNVVDELRIPYFTLAQVKELIGQHITETGQSFDEEVITAIYENTTGQPGLVCALCQYLVTEMVPDPSQPVTMTAFYLTLTHFLTDRFDKNIVNIVQKAREKQEFMLRVLFDDNPIPFTVNDPTIAYLYAHGVIANSDGYVDIPIPLYSKSLITAFRPLINGESKHYVSAHDTFRDYVTDQGLNLHALLKKYRDYIRRRGFHAFDTQHLKEGSWHYSLDNFLTFFLEQLYCGCDENRRFPQAVSQDVNAGFHPEQSIGGESFIEVPSGRGRTDILILYRQQKYIIETKVFTSLTRFENGKAQLADYLTSEGIDEGYYVVFSSKHSVTDMLFFDELIAGKRIYTYIIVTNFEKPSRRRPRQP